MFGGNLVRLGRAVLCGHPFNLLAQGVILPSLGNHGGEGRAGCNAVDADALAGQALTWNLEELLAARPVERGQSLLTVADLYG